MARDPGRYRARGNAWLDALAVAELHGILPRELDLPGDAGRAVQRRVHGAGVQLVVFARRDRTRDGGARLGCATAWAAGMLFEQRGGRGRHSGKRK